MSGALQVPGARGDWPHEAVDLVERLLQETAELRKTNAQLREALDSRIVIEQAKGVLAERFFLVPDQAFEAIRRASRNQSRNIHDVAREIVGSTQTPAAVTREIQRRSDGGVA